jgi:pimeloyl-ACP methyl ester carboxylesterase
VRKLAVALLAGGACAGALPSSAPARISFTTCGKSIIFACGHMTVPLDRSEPNRGVITLAMRRHRAPVEGPKSAVIALAGGPGQPAIPFTEDFVELLGPVVADRDLIVFDQRGTGLSHPLRCHVFSHAEPRLTLGGAITRCAGQLGSARSDYSTAESVADIEAIREAGGYEKLVLYGTSYGTKVALEYAQEYPSHVEALILDSVVPQNGPEPLHLSTIAAVPRILRQLCSDRQCAHITSNPVGDLERLLKHIRRRPLIGRVLDGDGVAHTFRITSDDLLEALVSGDLEPVLRSEFPAAVHSAADGDTAALARLLARAAGAEGASEGIDVPLYYATSCEDQDFPFGRSAAPKTRLMQARSAIQGLPRSAIAPFTTGDVLALSDIPACAFWPFPAASFPAPDSAPLPDVPTLILSGADDLRTPTADARSVAAQIPDAHLLVVPNTGHAVLGTEPTACGRKALQALFASKTIKRCRPGPPVPFLRPTAVAPTRLADVAALEGYHGLPGKTLKAVLLTLDYFARNIVIRLGEKLEAGDLSSLISLRTGGLRSGWAGIRKSMLTFRDFSYVPGVKLSGFVSRTKADLDVSGRAAAPGRLALGTGRTLVGRLGASRVRLPARSSKALEGSAEGFSVQTALAGALGAGFRMRGGVPHARRASGAKAIP